MGEVVKISTSRDRSEDTAELAFADTDGPDDVYLPACGECRHRRGILMASWRCALDGDTVYNSRREGGLCEGEGWQPRLPHRPGLFTRAYRYLFGGPADETDGEGQ